MPFFFLFYAQCAHNGIKYNFETIYWCVSFFDSKIVLNAQNRFILYGFYDWNYVEYDYHHFGMRVYLLSQKMKRTINRVKIIFNLWVVHGFYVSLPLSFVWMQTRTKYVISMRKVIPISNCISACLLVFKFNIQLPWNETKRFS